MTLNRHSRMWLALLPFRTLAGRIRRSVNRRLHSLLDSYVPNVLQVDCTSAICLTFDDGPSKEFTQQVASLLHDNGHLATFFFTGEQLAAYPYIAREVQALGHEVGLHSSSHPKSWETNYFSLLADYYRGGLSAKRVLGHRPRLFRPPYGHLTLAAKCFCLFTSCKLILWNIDTFDWKPDATQDEIFALACDGLDEGAILLFHDWIVDNPAARDRSATVSALKDLMPLLVSKGLRSVGVSDAIAMAPKH